MSRTFAPAKNLASRRLPHVSRLAPLALIFLALLIRLNGLTFQSLWRDEVDAICFAQAPLLKDLPQTALSFTPTCPPNIPELLAAFTQPGFNGPLYFLILRGWIGLFGAGEFALRSFSLMCGVISVALIITLGTRLFNRAVGLIAGSLLALSAYQVWYSQEAKMYTLITLLALASIYFLRRAVEEGRLRFWIGVVVCTSLAMGSHILAALLIPVQVIVFLLWWPQSRHHLIAGVITLACVTVPYLPVGIDRVKWAFEPAATGFAPYTLGDMLGVLGQAYTRGFFSSFDERVVVPSSSKLATKLARPALSGGSCADPVLINAWTSTIGRKCCSKTRTVMPFCVTNFVGTMSAARLIEPVNETMMQQRVNARTNTCCRPILVG